jgi:ribosomal protein S6--L-glutamate ligase
MKVIALCNRGGWHVTDLSRAAQARGDAFAAVSWRELVGPLLDGAPTASAQQVALDDADLVLLRTMPPGTLEQIVFRMDLLNLLTERGVRVLNAPRAVEAAVDKFLCSARLRQARCPTPPTIACQRLDDAMLAFNQLGGDVVCKPLFGSEGFGIQRLTDPALAQRAFALLERMGSVIYLQRYVDHGGCDLRLFVLGGQVIAAMRRTAGGDDWRTNIACGGSGEAMTPDAAVAALAVDSAAACGAWVAGVDIALDRAGQPWVLEVNAVPGWRELARVTRIDIAAAVLAAADRVAAER